MVVHSDLATAELRRCLAGGLYDTECNKLAAEHLAIIDQKSDLVTKNGIAVVPSQTLIADMLWSLEGQEEIPESVRKDFPEVTIEEWRAAMRFVVSVIASLNKLDQVNDLETG